MNLTEDQMLQIICDIDELSIKYDLAGQFTRYLYKTADDAPL
jgi:hypothetical protein